MTEAAPVLTVTPPTGRPIPGSVGQPLPGIDIRIDTPDARGVGEVLARGPNIMAGYYGNERATQGSAARWMAPHRGPRSNGPRG